MVKLVRASLSDASESRCIAAKNVAQNGVICETSFRNSLNFPEKWVFMWKSACF